MAIRLATAKIVGASPYSQSRKTLTLKEDRETSDVHERRTWRERMHTDTPPDPETGEVRGNVVIPPMALKNCLDQAASSLGLTVPGRGKKGYGKVFEAGVLCMDPIVLGVKAEDVQPEELFVPSDGRRGGGSRVTKLFPHIPEGQWGGEAKFTVLDDLISEDVFERVLHHAGQLVGLGRFRPQTRGFYGRFKVEGKIRWQEVKT